MSTPIVLAVDGGNSKTDVLVTDSEGQVLGSARGPGASPHSIGLAASVAAIERLVLAALAEAGLPDDRPFGRHCALYLAGLDLPEEETAYRNALVARNWADSVTVGNDAFALLRAGTSDGVGVAVVCGAGINCVGVGADGRVHRFPALGRISGDWGGGLFLGEEALWWAVRAEDGRGPGTALLAAVKAHFDVSSVVELVHRLHVGDLPHAVLHELCPVLFAVAALGDEVAQRVVDRLVDEVSVLATVSLRRLGMTGGEPVVVLGGGVLTAAADTVIAEIERRCRKVAPRAAVRVAALAPVVGAALAGLDAVGATPDAKRRLSVSGDQRLEQYK
ncbi:N-acetylglucosamine kinase-like BadF-type ATPase [Herbihabitans rhizosphaerae]|uniref:N-acetylglucosamine kinase-like BadF-type ATPase n=1 Tax=Herbihabitans rhizosphaerae TaxID=1872711 RepID=A0A4Q7L2T0_9PSEU|nr:BadF/BadG/BcrA/BcrD ATPase family protein [Herbihabitans rhizosphaerae]RZS43537.1 N-acetylglucosamine kinase-like BadF-type ATPase [Herbihabitans rhizosphaerae]